MLKYSMSIESKDGWQIPIDWPMRKWDEDRFHDYLLHVSRDKKYVLNRSLFPKHIELGNNEHAVFNEMREVSQDGFERIAIIGSNNTSERVIIGRTAKGNKTHVPGSLIASLRREGMDSGDFDSTNSDVHSHPRKLETNWLFKILNNRRGMFSTGDLYRVAKPLIPVRASGLVDGEWNLMVFETKESRLAKFDYLREDTQHNFSRYWFGKCGFSYVPHDYKNDRLGYVTPMFTDAKRSRVIPEICYHHLLSLYRGKQNEQLEQVNLTELLRKG